MIFCVVTALFLQAGNSIENLKYPFKTVKAYHRSAGSEQVPSLAKILLHHKRPDRQQIEEYCRTKVLPFALLPNLREGLQVDLQLQLSSWHRKALLTHLQGIRLLCG